MPKQQPTTVRLSPLTDELIRAEAKRTKRTKSAVLQAVADEGIRMRAFPGIGFKGEDARRRPCLIASGVSIWMVVEAHRDFGESIERMAAETDLDEAQIRLALAYYERFPEEIDEAIADKERVAEEYVGRFPTFAIPPE